MILVTGAAGFIGFHLTKKLLENGFSVSIDNLNNYYDIKLKEARLSYLNNINLIVSKILLLLRMMYRIRII